MSLVALMLPLATTGSLAAGPIELSYFSENAHSAFAEEHQCTEPVDDIFSCTNTDVFLFSGSQRSTHGSRPIRGTEVCYSTVTAILNQETGEDLGSMEESGCTRDVGDGTALERDLSSAVIAPTTITLETFVCDESECRYRGARFSAPSRVPRAECVLAQTLRSRPS